MTFAANETNAQGGVLGRKLAIEYQDSEGKPEVARKQAEKLALSGNKILLGLIASGEGLAIAPMVERWDAIYISTINKTDKLTGDTCQARVFRVNRPDAADAAAVRPWLASRKEDKWAIMANDIAWGRNSGESFTKQLRGWAKKLFLTTTPRPVRMTSHHIYRRSRTLVLTASGSHLQAVTR